VSSVSKDVVYDLLPGYFAGDLSPDSKALVEEWLRTDPEFAAMADRFKRLIGQHGPARRGDDAARAEAETLSRARTAARRQGEFRGLAFAYALAALLLVGAGLTGFRPSRAYTIASAFGVTAVLCAAGWHYARKHPEWFGDSRFW
jgi:ferric-dicitrate binding protein FerR (iron transport regulator)